MTSLHKIIKTILTKALQILIIYLRFSVGGDGTVEDHITLASKTLFIFTIISA